MINKHLPDLNYQIKRQQEEERLQEQWSKKCNNVGLPDDDSAFDKTLEVLEKNVTPEEYEVLENYISAWFNNYIY